jgi:hypothetical protein
MKPALLFLVKFVCLTAPFVWLWQVGGLSAYYALYNPVANAVYEWLGLEGVSAPARDRYINLVPFLALMVLTPNLSTRRRLGGTAIGLLILFANSPGRFRWLSMRHRSSCGSSSRMNSSAIS